MSEQQIPPKLVEAFQKAIDVYRLMKRGHNEQRVSYDSMTYTVGEVADLVSACAYNDKMPDDVYTALHHATTPTLRQKYLLRDGGDTYASGGALLRAMYDNYRRDHPKPHR